MTLSALATQDSRVILPALIGAASALLVVFLKDLLLTELRDRRTRKRELLDRRLSQLYGPLLVAMKGGEGTLGNLYLDDRIFERFITNLHLLSPELQDIAQDYMKLGKEVRASQLGFSEMPAAIRLAKRFNELLLKETVELREQFNGGFWRLRLVKMRLRRWRGRAANKAE